MESEILTLKEVGKYLRLHPDTIYKAARSGSIPCFKVGKSWRFRKDLIDKWSKLFNNQQESQNSKRKTSENREVT